MDKEGFMQEANQKERKQQLVFKAAFDRVKPNNDFNMGRSNKDFSKKVLRLEQRDGRGQNKL